MTNPGRGWAPGHHVGGGGDNGTSATDSSAGADRGAGLERSIARHSGRPRGSGVLHAFSAHGSGTTRTASIRSGRSDALSHDSDDDLSRMRLVAQAIAESNATLMIRILQNDVVLLDSRGSTLTLPYNGRQRRLGGGVKGRVLEADDALTIEMVALRRAAGRHLLPGARVARAMDRRRTPGPAPVPGRHGLRAAGTSARPGLAPGRPTGRDPHRAA